MSYRCERHGWQHIYQSCPKCYEPGYTTSATVPEALIGPNKSNHDSMGSEIEKLRAEVGQREYVLSEFRKVHNYQSAQIEVLTSALACAEEALTHVINFHPTGFYGCDCDDEPREALTKIKAIKQEAGLG